MRLALAQINTTVGDLDGNRERILSGIEEAKAARADIVLFPELAVTGYPPEDLLLRPGFIRTAEESLRELARDARGITALVGFPHFDRDLVLLQHGETLIGPTVCEDLWQPGPPATDLALAGAQLLTNISASPFHLCRDREREEMFATRARDNACFVAFCNAVGAQDELIFDGHSLVLDEDG